MTLAGVLAEQAPTLGDRPFLYFEDRVVSFAELDRQVNRAAHGLARLGVGSGVGVAIMLPNTPEWLFVYFATQKLGAYAVPVNVALKGDGLRHVIDHSDSSVLVVHPDSVDALSAVRDELPNQPRLPDVLRTRTAGCSSWTARPTRCVAGARTSRRGRSSARSIGTLPCSSRLCSACRRSSARTT